MFLSDVGEWLLFNEGMRSIWTAFYSTYLGRLSQFYHTLTLGSLVVALALFPLVLIGSKQLMGQYRQRFMQWVSQRRIVKFIKGTHFYQLYQTIGA
jgi:uncharacterized protein (TIGR03546 family)